MGRREDSFNRRRLRLAYISSVISTTLVLFVLGMIGVILSAAENFKTYIRENITLQVMFDPSASPGQVTEAASYIESLPQIKEARLISPEEAKEEFIREVGVDFTGVIENPLYYNMELRLKGKYFEADSISRIEADILQQYGEYIFEIHKDQVMISEVNKNLERASLFLLGISVVLALIMVALINNTIRLAIYSKRFVIKTMQLVGATGGFIRRPFLQNGILQGLIAAFLASVMIFGLLHYIVNNAPDLAGVFPTEKIALICLAMTGLGMSFTYIFTFLAVRKFLRLKADALY